MALLLIGVLVLAIPSVAPAQGAAKVVEVAVSGNVNINADTIRNAISLKPGMEYSEQIVEKDRAAIMSLGYFSAVTVHKEDVPGGVKVTYEVTENPKINGIKVVGNEPVPSTKIIDLMKTKPGQVLNTTTLNQDIEAIQSYYADQGYIAYVTEDIGVNPQNGILTIPILVNRVQAVEITGNKKTKSYVLLREMKTKPGQVFNAKTLKNDIIRIYNLDILEDVKPYQITPGTEIGMLKVTIPVVEKKTGQVSVGFGYSSRERLVGQARLAETNFRGRAEGLNLLWQQGTSTDTVGGSASYEVGFYEPWIDKNHTSLSVNGFDRLLYRFSQGIFNTGEDTYSERHKGGDATLSRPITEKTRVFLTGRFENVLTDENQLASAGSGLAAVAMNGDVTSGSLRLVHNSRDFDLDPAVGGYEGVSFDFGAVDGNRFQETAPNSNTYVSVPFTGPYTKASVDLRRYFSRGGAKTNPQEKRVTLAVRLRAGFGGGKIPFFEQFFAGGAESLRGYQEDQFWGDNMLLASAELRKPIAQAITGVVFVDYGDAWGADPAFLNVSGFPQTSTFHGHTGVGVGMRVKTPIGYLRLDYGYPVGEGGGGRTHFSMGQAF